MESQILSEKNDPSTMLVALLIELIQSSPNSSKNVPIMQKIDSFSSSCENFIQQALSELNYSSISNESRKTVILNILGWLNNSDAIPFLISTLKNENESHLARRAAAEALGYLNAKETVPILKFYLKESKNHSHLRCGCAIALGWLRTPGVEDILIDTIEKAEYIVKMAAIDALHNFHSENLNLKLVSLLSHLPRGTKIYSSIREILIHRDLIPLIFSASDSEWGVLKQILPQQPKFKHHVLQFIKDTSESERILARLSEIEEFLYPMIKLRNKFFILR